MKRFMEIILMEVDFGFYEPQTPLVRTYIL